MCVDLKKTKEELNEEINIWPVLRRWDNSGCGYKATR
jgi:hypothetical protein